MSLHKISRSLLLASLALAPTAAFAHPGHDTSGMLSGLLHPLMGWDHLLAMVAVGMLAVMGRSKPAWQLPLAFVGFMLVGAMLGINGVAIALVETGILLSLVVLGGLLAVGRAGYLSVMTLCCALFGMLHGNAHGIELPAGSAASSYISGFIMATIVLHAVGYLLASKCADKWQFLALRVSGVAIAGTGLVAVFSAA
ncbi:HupE/UreJ family protein [Oceanisphaera sp. W20_SRM_FM3]|uniref:HupE/UreJ family protein n=1 Tax=Oceanisphaera sp. W20_SRM_FM3 TaxID=3240267 RepID=UPI003F9AA160